MVAVRKAALVLVVCACTGEGADSSFPGEPDSRYERLARVGGTEETNELFQFGNPRFRLLDGATVVYSDARAPGRVVAVNILTGKGWKIEHTRGAEGQGELGGYTPYVSLDADTIKLLTPFGRLSARRSDGSLLFDSLLTHQNPGAAAAGIARHARVSVFTERRVGGAIRLHFESPHGFRSVPIDTVRTEEQIWDTGIVAFARGDLIVHTTADGTLHSRNGRGQLIASRTLPWKVFSITIDGSGRTWVQVYGQVEEGYNLVVLDRQLNTLRHAVIPGFRDAYGDYFISARKDEFGVPYLMLSRLGPGL